MIERLAARHITSQLAWSPAVGILGPRQVGQTTTAKMFAQDAEASIYLGLDTASARARLSNPPACFTANRQRLVVLDEIQNQPELLQELRALMATQIPPPLATAKSPA